MALSPLVVLLRQAFWHTSLILTFLLVFMKLKYHILLVLSTLTYKNPEQALIFPCFSHFSGYAV
jgi:hypothetical protein